MTTNNIYAVIDLGSATARGMVGYRNAEDRVVPLGYSERPSEHCVRNGYILNIDEASLMLASIVEKLNDFLDENVKIEKVYVGFGGRSLASTHYTVKRVFDTDGHIITKEDIDALWQEVRSLTFEGKEVLHINDPLFSVNGVQEMHPQGILCRDLEAKYQILTSRPQHARSIREMVRKTGLELAGIMISPLAEASVVLTNDERALGCCYVNIGAGCTSVSIYKNGLLAMLHVIPLGGTNVTKDIESLRLVRPDADLIKLQKASMQTEGIKEKKIRMKSPDRQTEREIPLVEVNRLAAARMREITVNFINIIRLSGLQSSLGAGIVIGGGGSKLKLYTDIVHEQLEDVRVAHLRPDLVDWLGHEPANADTLITSIGLLKTAETPCVGPAKSLDNLFDETTFHEISQPAKGVSKPDTDPYVAPSLPSATGTILMDADDDEEASLMPPKGKKKQSTAEKNPKGFGKRLEGWFRGVSNLFNGDEENPEDEDDSDNDKK